VETGFPRDKRGKAFARRSCSNKKIAREPDSTQLPQALAEQKAKRKSHLSTGPSCFRLVSRREYWNRTTRWSGFELTAAFALLVAATLTLLVAATLTIRILLLLSGLLATALLLTGLLARVLVLLARILVLIRHRDLPC